MKNNKRNDNPKLSLKEIRDGFYSRRDFEISNLWQRSIFLTAFLVLCFTGYGYLLMTNILGNDCTAESQILHEIACGISLAGITFSIIFIKMAKGSKGWFEVYEMKITEIEKEEELEIPTKYRMGKFPCKANSMDTNIFSTGAGAYSVSRLNVVIGIVLLVIWLIILIIHYVFVVCYLIETSEFIHLIPIVLIPLLFLVILLTAICNKWAESGAL